MSDLTPDTPDPVTPLTAEDRLREAVKAVPFFTEDDIRRDTVPIGTAAAMRDYQRRIFATLDAARQTPGAEAGLRERIDDIDGAATDYINAVLAYLDPENQYTESRRRAMNEASGDLAASIFRARTALQAAPVSIDSERDPLWFVDKAKAWLDDGFLTADQYGAVCAVAFLQRPEDMTPEDRDAMIERGRQIAAEHPEWGLSHAE